MEKNSVDLISTGWKLRRDLALVQDNLMAIEDIVKSGDKSSIFDEARNNFAGLLDNLEQIFDWLNA